jgi:hypothetical protein
MEKVQKNSVNSVLWMLLTEYPMYSEKQQGDIKQANTIITEKINVPYDLFVSISPT